MEFVHSATCQTLCQETQSNKIQSLPGVNLLRRKFKEKQPGSKHTMTCNLPAIATPPTLGPQDDF